MLVQERSKASVQKARLIFGVRFALLALPAGLALRCIVEPAGVLQAVSGTLGLLALVLAPGYALLWALGLDPLAGGGPSGLRWMLAVPLSLAWDATAGTLLVLTPIGLSACSLWLAMSVWVLAATATKARLSL
jgi:hypothetical protein